jgi:hypothetical protein
LLINAIQNEWCRARDFSDGINEGALFGPKKADIMVKLKTKEKQKKGYLKFPYETASFYCIPSILSG